MKLNGFACRRLRDSHDGIKPEGREQAACQRKLVEAGYAHPETGRASKQGVAALHRAEWASRAEERALEARAEREAAMRNCEHGDAVVQKWSWTGNPLVMYCPFCFETNHLDND